MFHSFLRTVADGLATAVAQVLNLPDRGFPIRRASEPGVMPAQLKIIEPAHCNICFRQNQYLKGLPMNSSRDTMTDCTTTSLAVENTGMSR